MNSTVRKGVLFNALSGGINAVQSVIWLMVITRALGLNEAGIFTIAYATSNLFLLIGKYGIRNFQVSDVKCTYNWKEYHISRFITLFFMLFTAFLYCIYMNLSGKYTIYKAMVIFMMTLLKAADSYEDVYYGMYQQNERLDIAGLAMSIRLGIQLVSFSLFVLCGTNLLISLIGTNIISWVTLFIILKICNKNFVFSISSPRSKKIKNLFGACAPLFLSSFISYYVCNLSKYEIDKLMTQESQAYFGFISMPVFVVYLFTNFIYQPILKDISKLWTQKNKTGFLNKISTALLLIGIISLIVLLVGYFTGIQGLGFLYNTDLSIYQAEFIILLIGSIFYAFSAFFSVILTVMRKQKYILYVHILVLCFSKLLTSHMIITKGILGASLSYAFTMGSIAILYLFIVLYQIAKKEKCRF